MFWANVRLLCEASFPSAIAWAFVVRQENIVSAANRNILFIGNISVCILFCNIAVFLFMFCYSFLKESISDIGLYVFTGLKIL